MEDALRELVVYRLARAKEELNGAKLLLSNGYIYKSVNSSYYSMFHAARALLAIDGVDFKKHSGVLAYFNRQYIAQGIFDKDLGHSLYTAFALRQESDYKDFVNISIEEAEELQQQAALFFHSVETYLHSNKPGVFEKIVE